MSLVRALVALWNRVCIVPWLLVRGERDLRDGRVVAARRRFEDAVRRAPTCFRAHFGLARVHAAVHELEDARRELVIARHLAPSRFRELRRALPEPLRDEPPYGPAGRDADLVVAFGRDALSGGVVRDDFSSAAERARFRRMGPIRDEELRATDWDRLAGDLDRRDG